MSKPPKPPKKPCGTCPYRRDVPPGVWHADEYAKLPNYDGSIMEQLVQDAVGLFMCHQRDGCLCGGWLVTHGAENLLALRLHSVDLSAFDYAPGVPCFESGAEAAAHGISGIDDPPEEARRKIAGLLKLKGISDD